MLIDKDSSNYLALILVGLRPKWQSADEMILSINSMSNISITSSIDLISSVYISKKNDSLR